MPEMRSTLTKLISFAQNATDNEESQPELNQTSEMTSQLKRRLDMPSEIPSKRPRLDENGTTKHEEPTPMDLNE